MENKITRQSRWRVLARQIFGLALGIIIILILIYNFPLMWWMIIPFMVIGISFDAGLGFYLYKEYLHYNRDCILCVAPENRKLSFESINNETITAMFNEIKEIIVYIPPNNYRNTVTITSMEDFSYARFELKDGREFYVTCLIIPKLKLKNFINGYLSGIPVEFRLWIFPSIRLCNYFRRKRKQESIQ